MTKGADIENCLKQIYQNLRIELNLRVRSKDFCRKIFIRSDDLITKEVEILMSQQLIVHAQ